MLVDLALIIAAVAVLATTTLFGFQALGQRAAYRQHAFGAAETAQRAIESCLRKERHIGRCKRGRDLTYHGFYPAKARLFDGIDSIEVNVGHKEAAVFVTPVTASSAMPSVTAGDDLILTATVITDANGNNRLSPWRLDPESGCAASGFCQIDHSQIEPESSR